MTDKLTPEQTAAHHYALTYASDDPRNIQTITAAAFYAGIEFAKAQAAGGTPAAEWRERGEPDPHDHDMYKGERSMLCLGNLTDDALANAVFMHYNDFPSPLALMSGEAKMPIVYVTAAKERIRWLSRKLEEARARQTSVAGLGSTDEG